MSNSPSQSAPLSTAELTRLVKELELRTAYHERLNQDLSDQVYALHREVEALKAQLTTLVKRLQTGSGEGDLGPANDPPPHY